MINTMRKVNTLAGNVNGNKDVTKLRPQMVNRISITMKGTWIHSLNS